jgi:hypothetical protein
MRGHFEEAVAFGAALYFKERQQFLLVADSSSMRATADEAVEASLAPLRVLDTIGLAAGDLRVVGRLRSRGGGLFPRLPCVQSLPGGIQHRPVPAPRIAAAGPRPDLHVSAKLPTYMRLIQFWDCREFDQAATLRAVGELVESIGQ